jgi:hypothetical protein
MNRGIASDLPTPAPPIHLVLNWFTDLKPRVPVK